jgi:hypothetical protein
MKKLFVCLLTIALAACSPPNNEDEDRSRGPTPVPTPPPTPVPGAWMWKQTPRKRGLNVDDNRLDQTPRRSR